MENNCGACGLHRLCNKPRIRARGNIDHPKLIIIGEAPGKIEDLEGEVFIGRSGQLLSEVLGEEEGLVYITNTVKCCPYLDPFDYERGPRKPSNQEIEWCRPFLYKELSLFNPKETAIMSLGNSPLTSLIGKHKGIEKEIGNIQFVTIEGRVWKLFPNYHPSYIIRGKIGTTTDKEFRNVVREALNHDKEEPVEDRKWVIAEPSLAIKESKLIVEAYKDKAIQYVLYDCETSGFLPWKHKIIMYSFYNNLVNKKSLAVPIHISNIMHHEDYPYMNKFYPINIDLSAKNIVRINHAIGEMIETVPIVGHNLKFDIDFAIAMGIAKLDKIRVYYDTLLLAHILIGRQTFGYLDLKTLCTKWFGVPNWELPVSTYIKMFRKIEDRTYANIPTSILGEYAALDTFYNDALFTALDERITNEQE